jgi:hypothetical protein
MSRRVIRNFRRPESLEDFTKMVHLLLEDTWGNLGAVIPHGNDAIEIEWGFDVPDEMPMVMIRVSDYDAEIAARVDELEKQNWERSPGLN